MKFTKIIWQMIGSPWLWTLATAVTTILALADLGVHFHRGWQEGHLLLKQVEMERDQCSSMDRPNLRFKRGILQEACSFIHNQPLPIPWEHAIHETWSGLMDRTTMMFASVFRLGLWLVSLFVIMAAVYILLFRGAKDHRILQHGLPIWAGGGASNLNRHQGWSGVHSMHANVQTDLPLPEAVGKQQKNH